MIPPLAPPVTAEGRMVQSATNQPDPTTMKFNPDLTYEFPSQLFAEHGAKTPSEYAQEAYDRTTCGVSTAFLLANGDSIMSSDLTPVQDTAAYASRHFVGVQHGTVVEGSDAKFTADPCLFPFSDEELAGAWQFLEERVDDEILEREDTEFRNFLSTRP